MDDVSSHSTPASPPEGVTRRHFYVGAIYAMGAAIAAALGLPAAVYLLLPPKLRKTDPWSEVGDIGGISANTPTEMTFRQNHADGWKVTSEKRTAWVVKHPDNSIVAFGAQCTHLGCAYHWNDGKTEFECPCHNSFFNIDGKVLQGPAPRPLDRYDTKVEGNKLFVGQLRMTENA